MPIPVIPPGSFYSPTPPVSSPGTRVIELQIGSWTADPYMLPTFAKGVTVGWTDTNISSIQYDLVGVDGSVTNLGNTPGTYYFPQGNTSKYAGSWGIDNGALYITDQGTDSLGSGISATLMADPETTYDFELGCGRDYTKLRLTVNFVDIHTVAHIPYPTWVFPTDPPTIHWESSKCAAMIFSDGPGLRWGQHAWYDPLLGFCDPPVVDPLGFAIPTMVDALCFYHRFLRGDGGSPLVTTITTDLTSIYDTFETQSIAADDKFSLGLLLPSKVNDPTIRLALVNAYSEVPPIACFPFRTRDSNWDATGSYGQVVYDLGSDTQNLVSANKQLFLVKPDGTTVVGNQTNTVSGWYLWNYSPVVSNFESTNWKICYDKNVEIAKVKPWRGWFALFKGTPPSGADLECIHDPFDRAYYCAYVKGTDIYVLKNTFSLPYEGAPTLTEEVQVTSSGTNTSPSLEFGSNGILYLSYTVESPPGTLNNVFSFSTDKGKTWSSTTTLFSAGDKYPRVTKEHNEFPWTAWAVFRYISGSSGPGNIWLIVQGPGDSALPTAVKAKDETGADIVVADERFDLSFSDDQYGRLLLFCKLDSSGVMTHFTSTNKSNTFVKVYP